MNEHLYPVNAAVALAALLFSNALSSVIGPYAVILAASMVGAAWSLGSRERGSNTAAVRYFVLMGATAMLVTVQIANGIALWLGLDGTTWLLTPVALMIGAIGGRWPVVMKWIIERIGRLIERRVGGDGGKS